MPSNKQIAGWLREAATKAALLRYYQNYCKEDPQQTEKIWLDRATLVESMRCETCEWWDISGHNDFCTSPNIKNEIYGEGPQFSCCHWEGKE